MSLSVYQLVPSHDKCRLDHQTMSFCFRRIISWNSNIIDNTMISNFSTDSRNGTNKKINILEGALEARTTALEFVKSGSSSSINSNKNFIDTDGDILSVSPEVISSMLHEALEKRDDQTLHMLIGEAYRVGKLTDTILESCMTQCLHAKDYRNCTILLVQANSRNLTISQDICQQLLTKLVNNCQWNLAASTATYMINNNYMFLDREIFFIMGGLMRNKEGVEESLNLISLIADKRRLDLAVLFSYNKVRN